MRSLCIASLEVAHLWSISVSDMDPGGASRNPTLQDSSSSDEGVPAAQGTPPSPSYYFTGMATSRGWFHLEGRSPQWRSGTLQSSQSGGGPADALRSTPSRLPTPWQRLSLRAQLALSRFSMDWRIALHVTVLTHLCLARRVQRSDHA